MGEGGGENNSINKTLILYEFNFLPTFLTPEKENIMAGLIYEEFFYLL